MAISDGQSPVILDSKLEPPVHRPGLVDRAALAERLEGGDSSELRAIVAPTGWGKSQLLAQWLEVHSGRVAYVGLDRLDNDGVRCWAHIIAAVGRALARDVSDISASLRAPGLPLATEVVDPLIARIGIEPLTVVLEDFHVVTDAEVLESVEAFIDGCQSTATMVVVSRVEPALHLPRRRVLGELVEIRLEDLRMSEPEAQALIAAATGLDLDEDLVARLVSRTEGWAAGLYLAALSLRTARERRQFVEDFAGDDRMISDYLASEVMAGLADEDRTFLLGSSVLDEVEAEFCNELLERSDSAQRIETISQANLFLVPTDRRAGRFRYHQLFREWLQLEAEREQPGVLKHRHRRAASLHVARGEPVAAVDHALASRDGEYALELVLTSALPLIDSGSSGIVSDWCSRLPPTRTTGPRSRLAFLQAWLGVIDGDLDAIERNCLVAERLVDKDRAESPFSRSTAGEIALLRGYASFLEGSLDAADGLFAAARAAGVSPRTQAALTAMEAAVGYWLGTPDEERFQASRALAEREREPVGVVLVDAYLANILLDRFDYSGAASRVSEAFDRAERNGLTGFRHMAVAHVARARLALLDADAKRAIADCERAVDLAERRNEVLVASLARLVLGEARHTLGDPDARDPVRVAAADISVLVTPGMLAERLQTTRRQLRLPNNQRSKRRLSGPIEELTDRETALLRLLPGSLNQRELGQALHVSLNTIKTYNRQIYRKLGVASRNEAVESARFMGLL